LASFHRLTLDIQLPAAKPAALAANANSQAMPKEPAVTGSPRRFQNACQCSVLRSAKVKNPQPAKK
jgi:hypothetical protein